MLKKSTQSEPSHAQIGSKLKGQALSQIVWVLIVGVQFKYTETKILANNIECIERKR